MRIQRIISVLLVAALVGSPAVLAQEGEGPQRESPQAIWKSERNFKAVNEAWEMVAEELYVEAEATFRELLEKMNDPYERSQAMFGMAQALMMQEKYNEALDLYEQIVELDILPNKPHFDAMFQLSQLYYMRERYEDSLRWINRWGQESGELKVEAFELRATIFAQLEDYRPAIENIDQAIALSDEPKQTWYQLKLAMHFELEEFPECKEVLEILVRGWPDKKQYWTQLASINVTLKLDEEALAVMALAKRKGMLDKESEWMQLFSLYGFLNIPHEAAKTLAEGLEAGYVEPTKKAYEQMGNAYYAAQELDEAVEALSNAADLSLDGKLDMQVAYILVDKEDWESAKTSLANAIEKGGISEGEMGNMYVLLGMSEVNTGNSSAARRAFQEARRFPKTRSAAQQWLNHIDELAKQAAASGP